MVERYQKQQLPQQIGGSARMAAMSRGLGFNGTMPRMRPATTMGVSGISVYSGIVRTKEKSADWVGTKKWETIADLSVNVSIVAASVQYFLNMVAHPQWTVKPAIEEGEEDQPGKGKAKRKEAEDLAAFVEEVIHDMTTPWQRIVRRAGMYRFNGFGIQEWIAKKRPDGKIGLLDVEPRPPFTIERWDIDDDGTILGVWQRSPQTGQLIGLPRGKLVYIVDDTLTDQPDGLGVYRMMGETFNRLKQYLELEARAYERDMRGIPLGRAPISVINQMVNEGKLKKEEGEQMLLGLRNFITTQVRDKDTSLLMDSLPYENQTADGLTIAGAMQWDVSLMSGGVSGLSEMANAIDRLQREMARIIGTEHLMMGDKGGGSRAMAADKSKNLYLIANSVLGNISDSMDHDLIEPLWILNGFDPELKPYFSTEDVAFKDVQEIATALGSMATAGAVLAPDDPAINDVRDLLGISRAPEQSPDMMGLLGPRGVQTPAKPPAEQQPGDTHPVATDDAKSQQVADSGAKGPPQGTGKPAVSPASTRKPGNGAQAAKHDDEPLQRERGVGKFNPNHDEQGRFSEGAGGSGGEGGTGSGTGSADNPGSQYTVSPKGQLEGYTAKPAASASELYARTVNPDVTPDQVMAIVSPEAASRAAEADRMIAAGEQTQTLNMKNGKYTNEREALHDQILDHPGKGDWKGFTPEAIAAATPAAGEQPTFHILGGRGGSGKSWFSKSPDSPFDTAKTMYINNDDFKESLPEYQGWNAALVHEEASDLASAAHDRARAAGLNVTFDATMKSTGSIERLVQKYISAGYKVEGYYMHTAPQVSAVRAMNRFMHTGRYVPAEYVLKSTTNEQTFDGMTKYFSKWKVYDNNAGDGPKLVASSK